MKTFTKHAKANYRVTCTVGSQRKVLLCWEWREVVHVLAKADLETPYKVEERRLDDSWGVTAADVIRAEG